MFRSKLIIKVLRPKQWIKNLLVAVAPIAAGQLGSQTMNIILGIIGFSAASSFGYLANDWKDRHLDKEHPKKNSRPFASGDLKINDLIVLMLLCLLVVIYVCINLPGKFILTVFAYLVITLSYTFIIKQIPVLEMIWLAFGFLVRAIAGSAIISQQPTGWFLVTVGFGSLFVVSAKRLGEFKSSYANLTRIVIRKYNESFLSTVLTAALTITLLTYCLWVFEIYPHSLLAQITILPFTFTLFWYAWICESGNAESPEDLMISNWIFLFAATATILPIFITIYL